MHCSFHHQLVGVHQLLLLVINIIFKTIDSVFQPLQLRVQRLVLFVSVVEQLLALQSFLIHTFHLFHVFLELLMAFLQSRLVFLLFLS
jgi:hypothetical protein